MNKIYRTVYNETTGTWVAVCEIAKTHTKSSGSTVDNATASVSGSLKARSLTAIAASLALLSPLAVSPAFAKPWDEGYRNDVTGSYSNASGQNNTVSGINSFASGKENTASGEYSTAVGDSNKAGGLNSVSLGGRNNQSTAHGSATLGGEYNDAGAEYSATVGGYENTATGRSAVAWGNTTFAGSMSADAAWLKQKYNPDGTLSEEATVIKACKDLGGTNSCKGLNPDSSSNNTNKTLQGIIDWYNAENWTAADPTPFQTNYGTGVSGKGENATSWGLNTVAGNNQATAFGENSIANGENSTAFGKESYAYADNSLAALGGQVGFDSQDAKHGAHSTTGVNSVAIGEKAWVRSDNAFALGKESLIDTGSANSVAIGSFSKVGPNATNSFAAVGGQAHNNNTIAIGVRSQAYGEGSLALGSGITSGNTAGAYSKGEGSIAIGKRAEALGAQVHYDGDKGGVTLPQLSNEERKKRGLADPTGHEYSYERTEDSAYASQMIAIGDNASAYGNQSIAIGGNSVASGYASIAIGGDDIGNLKDDSPTKTLTDYLASGLNGDLSEEKGFTVPSTIKNLNEGKPWVNLTTTKGHLSTAIGIKAVAEGDLSNAYGIAARSAGKNSNAFGTVSYAGGDESIAFGTAAETGNDANNSVALGYMSQVDGKNSAAVGQKNKVSKDNTFVLGNSVKGDLENSVYLGAGSTTKTSAARGSTQAFKSAEVGGVTYGSTLNKTDTVNGAGFAGHTPVGIVSVGSVDDKGKISARRIQNVAAGAISEKSTDAINGSQLYAVLPKYTDDGKGNATSVTIGDKTYNLGGSADGNDNTVTELTVNGGNAPENKTGNLKLTDKGKNGNHKYDVSLNDQVDLTDAGSLKVGGDKDGSPVTNVTAGNIDFGDQQGSVTNVKGHLGNVDSTYNAGNDHTLTAPTASLAGDGGTLDTPLAVEKFRNSNNPALNEAATLGDVLNAGWELRANGQEVDFITHADAINFKSSDNSISVAGEYDANNISNIDLKANVKLLKDGAEAKDGDTANAIKVGDNTYNLGDGGDANWNLTVDGGNATTAGGKRNLKDSNTIDVAQDGNDILFNVKTTPLTVNNGVVGKPAAPNSLVTAGDVQTAINNSGWFVNSGAVAGRGTNSGAAKTLVKAGEEVKFIAGDGMNIVQNGKEFTFNAKIVDSNGKQLTVDKDGNYVVSIVDPKGKPVTINSDGQYVVDGGSGNGNPFTITADDGSGKPSTTTIDGVKKTPGAGVAFVGDENTSVTKQETPNGTNVQVGLNDVVNVGGKPDANNPNKKPVTIDGKEGNITFNGDESKNEPSVTVSNQDGNLSVGDTKVVNMKPGENPTDGVNVSQLLDTVGAASSSPATDENGKPITDNNGNSIGNVVSTPGSDGKGYTLKTYNVNGQGEYLTNNVVEAVSKMNEQGIKFFHVNDGNQEPVAQAKNEVDSQAFGKNAVAIGVGSIAKGENSIAIGTGNEVSGKNSGAIGDPNEVSGNGSYVLGNDNKVATDNTFVLGNEVTNTAANSVFLGYKAGQDTKGAGATGTVSSATVGDISYGGFAGEKSVGMVSVGNATQVRRVSGVAAGEISETSTDAINGSQLYAALNNSGIYVTGNKADGSPNTTLVKLGDKTGGLNFVDGKGTTAVVNGNTVTFNALPGYYDGIEAGENVVFTEGDPVYKNGAPVYIDDAGEATTDVTKAKKDAKGEPIPQRTTVINAKQPDLRPLQHQVEQVENNSYAGVAQAMATAGLPQAYLPGKSMVAVAGGYYKGESGYALGVSTISDSGNWVFKATASGNSRNNYGGTVGAGYQW